MAIIILRLVYSALILQQHCQFKLNSVDSLQFTDPLGVNPWYCEWEYDAHQDMVWYTSRQCGPELLCV